MRLEERLRCALAGGVADSSGHFTLGLGDCINKLRQFRLPGPGFFLLKLVQAAVAAGAQAVDVRLTGRRRLVTFCAPRAGGLNEISALLNGLAEPDALCDGALRHLVVGLAGALDSRPEEILWLVRRGDRGARLVIGAGEICSDNLCFSQQQTLPFDNYLVCVSYPFEWRFWEQGKRLAGESHLLSSRCRFAPITVRVDGRPLGRAWEQRPLRRGTSSPPTPANLLERYLLDEAGPIVFDGEATGESTCLLRQALRAEAASPAPPKDAPLRCRAAFCLPKLLSDDSTVGLVKDGVLLDPVTERFGGPGVTALWPADGISVDSTEFRVVRDQTYRALVEASTEHVAQMLAELRQNLDRVEDLAEPSLVEALRSRLG